MTTAIETHGACDSRFNAVKDAFAENFPTHGEVGAALAVMVDGELVVDLWAGHADPARTRPWERDTIVNVYSTTKGMTAICAHRLVDQGLLDLDAPANVPPGRNTRYVSASSRSCNWGEGTWWSIVKQTVPLNDASGKGISVASPSTGVTLVPSSRRLRASASS